MQPCKGILRDSGLKPAQDCINLGSLGQLYPWMSQWIMSQFSRFLQFFAPHVQGMGASPGVVSNCTAALPAEVMGMPRADTIGFHA